MYTMKDVCIQYNMPYETLRYYCNEGLIPNVKRDHNNYRVFDERDLAWINGLQCLRKCGLSIKDLKIYMNHALVGEKSIPQRQAMLEKQKAILLQQKKELLESLAYIEQKQSYYQQVLTQAIPYTSNLIDLD
jgi:MerR family transcriptional regulator, aldehyde-responsive regulator